MSDEEENEYIPCKVVLLGETGVGKTSILTRYVCGTFSQLVMTSTGSSFVTKYLDVDEKNKVKFQIWDTAGQEKYRSLAKIFYKDARMIIFVYDITTQLSFNALKDFWYKEAINTADNDPIFAIVANKIDLYQEQQVKNNEGQAFADEINAIFQVTSAMSNSGITKLFDNLGKKIIMPNFDYKVDENEAKENYMKKKSEEKEAKNHEKEVKGFF